MNSMQNNPCHGSSLDDFLAEEGILEKTTAHAIKQVLAWQLEEARKAQKTTKNSVPLPKFLV